MINEETKFLGYSSKSPKASLFFNVTYGENFFKINILFSKQINYEIWNDKFLLSFFSNLLSSHRNPQ